MRISARRIVPSSTGLLLLDTRLNPVFMNRAAAEILSYPQTVEGLADRDQFLAQKIRTCILQRSAMETTFPAELRSGRRVYLCRALPGDWTAKQRTRKMFAVLLERKPANEFSIGLICERFNLTIREQRVLELLLEGLTSKEIATRMEISPNTVKAFLRLIMIKMGVSTRSGIVGKALTSRA